MKRYDAEVGLDSTGTARWRKMALERGCWRWLWEWRCWSRLSPGTIVINPVAVASVLVYVIAASVALYFIWLFVFAGLNRKSGRLLVCFILLVSAAFSGPRLNRNRPPSTCLQRLHQPDDRRF